MNHIGLMVGLLLAGLIGWYFLAKRTGGNLLSGPQWTTINTNGPNPATAAPFTIINGISYGADGKPLTTDSQGVTADGRTFITKQSSAGQLAAASGASSYDPNTVQSATNRVNAIYEADRQQQINQAGADSYNSANGTTLTADQWAALNAQLKIIQSQTTQVLDPQVQAALDSGACSPDNTSQYCVNLRNYAAGQGLTSQATPVLTSGPTTETRSGRGHF